MRILITGANGFIAREIIAQLFVAGHEIIASVHGRLFRSVPHAGVINANFIKATTTEYWLPYLTGIDAVINCVGVFQTYKEKDMWSIHYDAPKALFEACVQCGVKKIIQISAIGIDRVDAPYAKSKLAIDEYLETLNIDSAIIRPSLVYGKGSYGGSSLLRGLVGLPFIIPMPSGADSLQQPIHIDDLTAIVEKTLPLPGKQILCAVGAEQLALKNVLIKLRTWLGFKKAQTITIPSIFIRFGAKIGNFIHNSPMSETGVKMMAIDIIASEEETKNLESILSFKPRSFTSGLNGMVSSVQDRWHARLYFLRPLLRISIAFIWIFSGVIGFLPTFVPATIDLMNQAGVVPSFQGGVSYLFNIIDILLGLATLLNYRLVAIGSLQCICILIYTITISLFLPIYWLHPFAPIAKNVPLFMAVLIMMALESER